MNFMKKLGTALGVIVVLSLGACADPYWSRSTYDDRPNYGPNYGSNYGTGQQNSGYAQYGVVQSIEMVQQDSRNTGSTIGLGTVGGAVVGGVVGNQVGSGSGRAAATVLGAAGGAYVGHELENQQRNQQQMMNVYRITVRMEDGSYQTVMQSNNPDLRIGDQVRLQNGILQRE